MCLAQPPSDNDHQLRTPRLPGGGLAAVGAPGARGKLYDAAMTEGARVDLPDWIRALAASRPFGDGDRRGTANPIDAPPRAPAPPRVPAGSPATPPPPPPPPPPNPPP